MVELGRKDCEVKHTLLRQHGEQRTPLAQQIAAQPPDRQQRQRGCERAGQIHRRRPASGHHGDGLQNPCRKRRVLEIDDLPLASPGELLDHVQWQIVLQQRRQQPPDQHVQQQHAANNNTNNPPSPRGMGSGGGGVRALLPSAQAVASEGNLVVQITALRRIPRRPATPSRRRRTLRRATVTIAATLARHRPHCPRAYPTSSTRP